MKNKKSRSGYGLLLWGLIVCAHAIPSSGYEQWEQQQKQHDIRLKTQTNQAHQLALNPVLSATPKAEVAASPRLGMAITVNINRASAQELSAKLDSIGPKKAQAIVDYRNQHGGFKRIEDLKNVKGIGQKTFERNQTRLKLQD